MPFAGSAGSAGNSGNAGSKANPLDLDAAARHLISPRLRLIVIDDVDRGGPDAAAMLAVVAARCAASATAVIVTTSVPLGLRAELRIAGLSQADLAAALELTDEDTAHALWIASRGLPGVALPLAQELTASQDPVVHLALRAAPAAAFLDVDQNLIRLLELAAERSSDDATRARVLARLARELLGDATAGPRRRALTDEALRLARGTEDPGTLAVVLDARLYALWDPGGAEDRLAAGSALGGRAGRPVRGRGRHRQHRAGRRADRAGRPR